MTDKEIMEGGRAGYWEKRYSILVNTTTDVVLLKDLKKGRFVEANPAAAAFTGYTTKEIMAMNPESLYARARCAEYGEALDYSGRGRCSYVHDALIARKDGVTVPVDIAAFSLERNGVECVQEVWRDRSERLRPSELLEKVKAARDEGGVADTGNFDKLLEACRTLMDSEQRLIDSAKMASLGEMGAGIAHELNSPLAGILSITEVLMGRLSPVDPNYHLLETVKDAAVRSKYIILDMLNYAREESSVLEPIYLNAVLRATLGLFVSEFKTSSIEIVEDFDSELPMILANRGRVMEVIFNIIKNARDAMEGRGTLFISTRAEFHQDKEYGVAEIRDTGSGIAVEARERIFEPFFTTKGNGGCANIGLGLSIARTIVSRHGGKIEAENLGKGAVFRVYLPLAGAVVPAG